MKTFRSDSIYDLHKLKYIDIGYCIQVYHEDGTIESRYVISKDNWFIYTTDDHIYAIERTGYSSFSLQIQGNNKYDPNKMKNLKSFSSLF